MTRLVVYTSFLSETGFYGSSTKKAELKKIRHLVCEIVRKFSNSNQECYCEGALNKALELLSDSKIKLCSLAKSFTKSDVLDMKKLIFSSVR